MVKQTISFDNFMSRADVLFKTFGLIINIKSNQTAWSWLWRLFYYVSLFNLCLVIISETIFIVMSLLKSEHFLAVTMSFCCIGFASVSVVKVSVIMWNKTKLLTLQQELRRLFPKHYKQQLSYNVPFFLQFYKNISYFFVIMHLLLIWSFNMSALFTFLVKRYLLHVQDVQAALPYDCYIPWKWEGNWTYYLIYAIFCFAGQTCMSAQLASDLLFFANCTQLLMYYRQLEESMLQFEPVSPTHKDAYINRRFLNQFITRHQKLLRYLQTKRFEYSCSYDYISSLSESINEVFGISILINFVSSALVMCFLGFQITVGVETYIIVMLLLFLACSLLQAYMISMFGQKLMDAVS